MEIHNRLKASPQRGLSEHVGARSRIRTSRRPAAALQDPTCEVGLADVLDRSAWAAYTGNGRWSQNIQDAAPAFCGGIIPPAVCRSVQRPRNVVMRTSLNPEGPWSSEVQAFTAMQPEQGGAVYDVLAHPEYIVDGRRIMYVSYSRATSVFSSEVRLVAVEVKPPN